MDKMPYNLRETNGSEQWPQRKWENRCIWVTDNSLFEVGEVSKRKRVRKGKHKRIIKCLDANLFLHIHDHTKWRRNTSGRENRQSRTYWKKGACEQLTTSTIFLKVGYPVLTLKSGQTKSVIAFRSRILLFKFILSVSRPPNALCSHGYWNCGQTRAKLLKNLYLLRRHAELK